MRGVLSALGVLALLVSSAAVVAAAGPPFVRYADPDKLFSIEYPSGWHIKRTSSHVTAFYVDDPDEGTVLSLYLPPMSVVMRGEHTASDVFGALIFAPNRKRYPDFTVIGHEERVLAGNSDNTMLQAEATWTNSHKVKMRGYVKVTAFKNTGAKTTWVTVLAYGSPASAFTRNEATFGQMVKSLTYGPGR
ncbi:MAG: hypothetical protein ACYDAB_17160 [bacterium]